MRFSPSAMDWTIFRLHAADDEALMVELARVFLDAVDGLWREAERAAGQGEAAAAAHVIHRLKSSLAVFGAEEARALAQDLEDAARAGQAPSPAALASFRAMIDAVGLELRSFQARKGA